MVRRLPALAGTALSVAGFAVALCSLVLPWASYRVSAGAPTDAPAGGLERTGDIAVFQLDQGFWYVLLLFTVFGLLLGAAAGTGRAARACGVAALLLAVLGMLVTTALANATAAGAAELAGVLGTIELRTSTGSGPAAALAALPLLGFGAALLSVRTRTGPAGTAGKVGVP